MQNSSGMKTSTGDKYLICYEENVVHEDIPSHTAMKLRKKDRFYGIMMYTNKFKGSMSKKGSNKIYSK